MSSHRFRYGTRAARTTDHTRAVYRELDVTFSCCNSRLRRHRGRVHYEGPFSAEAILAAWTLRGCPPPNSTTWAACACIRAFLRQVTQVQQHRHNLREQERSRSAVPSVASRINNVTHKYIDITVRCYDAEHRTYGLYILGARRFGPARLPDLQFHLQRYFLRKDLRCCVILRDTGGHYTVYRRKRRKGEKEVPPCIHTEGGWTKEIYQCEMEGIPCGSCLRCLARLNLECVEVPDDAG